jgi:cystathionine beta-lyase
VTSLFTEAEPDFDAPVDRTGTGSLKWDRYAGRDVIPLWVADMDFRSPAAVVDALHRRIEHGVFGYGTPPPGAEAAVLAMLQREYDWTVQPEWLVWLPGLVTGLNVLCRSVGSPGDQVVTMTPVYPPFLSAPVLAGREVIRVRLKQRGGRWTFDVAALERELTPRARLLLVCSPHNPTGRVWTEDELQALADVALRHGLVIGSDEIHAGLILDEHRTHLPIACLGPEIASRTVTLMAPSKTFNIPGLGCSFAVISDAALRRGFTHAMEGIVPHVNVLGYVAAQAAYEQGEPWRQALLAYLRGNRDLVEEAVTCMPGVGSTHVEATYLAWIDTRASGIRDPMAHFERGGVGLSDGAHFGAPGYVRLNFGCRRAVLQEALERMHKALTHR